jgi:hypothetical protein
MLQSLLRWLLPLTGLLLVGPLCGLCTAGLRLPDGTGSATLLVSTTPGSGLLLGAAAIALATIVGVVASRLINASYGFFSAGLTLAWAAWGTGNIDSIVRSYQSGAPLWRLAIEGAIVGALGVGACALILKAARKPAPATPAADAQTQLAAARSADDNPWLTRGGAFAAALAAAGVVGWIFAPESLKGQTFAAAAFAGMLGALAMKMTARHVTPLVVFAAIGVLACAGPAAAAVYYGTGSNIVRSVYAGVTGSFLPLARILPLDWLAGALVGVPIGLSWGAAMTDHQH